MPKPAPTTQRPPKSKPDYLLERVIPLLTGVWLSLSLLKWGNPIILDKLVEPPHGLAEFLLQPWPFAWGVILAALLFILGFSRAQFKKPGHWIFWLPAAWFVWQIFAGARSVAPDLTNPTLVHFGVCAAAFYFGWFTLARVPNLKPLWIPLILAFGWALFQGFSQQNGGLEAARNAFYERPDWQTFPREYLLRLSTGRIFSTMVYPNAFAGAILLFGPILLWTLWQYTVAWPRIARGVVSGIYGYIAILCLYWTGSKGGWLVALGVAGLLLLYLPGSKKVKVGIVSLALVLGLTAFFIRFSAYFQKGAPSVGARFSYWDAAWKTALANPIFGSGPGTFAVPYREIKAPEAEMTRLVHNDYLEQASDSGWLGALLYVVFVFGSFSILYRQSWSKNWEFKLILAGIAAWIGQGFIEFGLYIPALAWPVFLFLGWGLKISSNPIIKSDKENPLT